MKFLGWIDHDAAHEASVLRALGAAKGQDAREELGLGTIRDVFSDLFFPGLSTIQTRARYFLFVQWCCEIAARRSGPSQVLDTLRQTEVELIAALTPLGERKGVIGIVSQDQLERMPSEIYWTGMAVLRMRQGRASRLAWARAVASQGIGDAPIAEDAAEAVRATGFDPQRPGPPAGFPRAKGIDFALSGEEASFLRQRFRAAHVDPGGRGHEYNLFGVLSGYRRRTNVAFPWDHPRIDRLGPAARDLLELAAAFSRVMHGATILYNLRVGELVIEDGGPGIHRDRHLVAFEAWRDTLQPADVALLLDRLPEIVPLGVIARHQVAQPAISFVRAWARHCRTPATLLSGAEATRLVSARETALKSARGTSRILSRKARSRWNGESGGMIEYRWAIARQYLNDLADAR
jgi:hypothetical protein